MAVNARSPIRPNAEADNHTPCNDFTLRAQTDGDSDGGLGGRSTDTSIEFGPKGTFTERVDAEIQPSDEVIDAEI